MTIITLLDELYILELLINANFPEIPSDRLVQLPGATKVVQRERERFTSSPTFLCGSTPATLG